MNTIGKILVVCNLLVALAAAGFFAYTYVTRENWRKGYEDIKRELEVAHANSKTLKETHSKLNDEITKAYADKDVAYTKMLEKDIEFKAALALEQLKTEESLLKTKEAELNLQKSLAEQDRLKEEVKGLLNTITQREQLIADLEDQAKKATIDSITYKNDRDTIQARNDALYKQVRDLLQKIAEMQNTGVSGGTLVKDSGAPNPPATFVKGIVEKVDRVDNSLIEISLGTDHGVKKNHTLVVYRRQPRPEYLGTIRIIDSYHNRSVGKLERNQGTRQSPLREGDIVASSLDTP